MSDPRTLSWRGSIDTTVTEVYDSDRVGVISVILLTAIELFPDRSPQWLAGPCPWRSLHVSWELYFPLCVEEN